MTVRRAVLTKRTIKDVSGIETKGVLAAKKVVGQIKAQAMKAFRAGNVHVSMRPIIVKTLHPILLDCLMAGHAMGMRRSYLMRKNDPGMSFTMFDELLKFLKRSEYADFGKLQHTYNTEALKILNGVSDHVESELRKTMIGLISEGAHVSEGIDVLNDKFDALGLTPMRDYQLETIFRTQSQLAYGAGRWMGDQDPDLKGAIWGYQYSAVGDARTRPTHAALDGVTLPKTDPFWSKFWPPNGWNCRCTVIPLYDETTIVEPPDQVDGQPIKPDPGFGFNPGQIFGTAMGFAFEASSDFDEDKHPRDEHGKFTSSGGMGIAVVPQSKKEAIAEHKKQVDVEWNKHLENVKLKKEVVAHKEAVHSAKKALQDAMAKGNYDEVKKLTEELKTKTAALKTKQAESARAFDEKAVANKQKKDLAAMIKNWGKPTEEHVQPKYHYAVKGKKQSEAAKPEPKPEPKPEAGPAKTGHADLEALNKKWGKAEAVPPKPAVDVKKLAVDVQNAYQHYTSFGGVTAMKNYKAAKEAFKNATGQEYDHDKFKKGLQSKAVAQPKVESKVTKTITSQTGSGKKIDVSVAHTGVGVPYAAKHGIQQHELEAINSFTGSMYTDMRKYEWSGEGTAYVKQLSQSMNSALTKLPPYSGTTYRGMSISAGKTANYEALTTVGSVFKFNATSSSSESIDKAKGFGNHVFIINGKTGRDIQKMSHYKHEKEIVLLKDAQFKITKVQQSGTHKLIYLDEVLAS